MTYQYKMVQLPGTIAGQAKGEGEAAAALERVVNEHARHGWEFYRVDSFSTTRPQGCLAGGQPSIESYNVVSFRQRVT